MIFLNFLNVPSGGGLQNAASFLQTLVEQEKELGNYTCFILKDTVLERMCIANRINSVAVKKGVVNKTLFEIGAFLKVRRGDVVFSIFGPPLLFTTNYTINVGGMAISNVFYPEIDFWGYLPPFKKFIKKVKDRYRIIRYKKLDYWVFETELLAEKAIRSFNFPADRLSVIKMAPSALVSPERVKPGMFSFSKENFKVLMLCNAHPNKRHHALPELAFKLKRDGKINIQFIFTSSENDYYNSVLAEARLLNVSEFFINVGVVEPENVASLIDSVDFLMNISVLESFSNNFVEAWAMAKPLLTVRDEWAYASAKQAALYIDIENDSIDPKSFWNAISKDNSLVVMNGLELLKSYPSAIEKNIQYLDVIERASNIGNLATDIRRGISL